MTEKFNSDNLSIKELAAHLRKPSGSEGIKIGVKMNKGNKLICLNSYLVLAPKENDSILEIGMGNGYFVKDLLLMAKGLKYTGVDFSNVMVEEAQKINSELKNVSFKEASVEKIPFKDHQFDLITTTNTIYFWPNLIENLKEIARVLKPNGKLLIAYRSKTFLEKIEISNYGFSKFEHNDVENLLDQNGFKKVETIKINEPEIEFEKKLFSMEGLYTIGFK